MTSLNRVIHAFVARDKKILFNLLILFKIYFYFYYFIRNGSFEYFYVKHTQGILVVIEVGS